MCRCNRPGDQIARATISLPFFYVNKFTAATKMAEDIIGKPPTAFEIFITLERHFGGSPVENVFAVGAILYNLFREDMLFADERCNRFTTVKKEGFMSFSEMFRQKFPQGYTVSTKDGSILATTARTVSFKEIISILKSKDEEVLR